MVRALRQSPSSNGLRPPAGVAQVRALLCAPAACSLRSAALPLDLPVF